MRRLRENWPIILFVLFVVVILLSVYFGRNQGTSSPIPAKALDTWFTSRLWLAVLSGLVLGSAWAWHLSSAVRHEDGLDIAEDARRRFLFGLACFVIAGLVTILIDAWLIHHFKPHHLGFFEALSGVVADWRSIALLLVYSVLFVLSGGLYFRFGCAGGLPMRYAFWTRPKID